ncbi:MAG: hypothetical protein ACD_10C00599G0001 [uncultured bacterium]|nr:MAG: hypothetical protein ACD_10C00599G0001 [uncultured bacterium]
MFVGDCNGRLVIANPVIELDHPQLESVQRIGLVLVQAQRGLQNTACPLNQKTTQIGIAAPGDGPQMRFATAPVLARGDAEARGKLTTVLELTCIADRGNDGIGSERSNSRPAAQTSYRGITLALLSNLSFTFSKTLVQYADLLTDALCHQLDALRIGGVTFQFGQFTPDLGRTEFHDDAKLREQSTDPVEQRSSLRLPPFTQAVPG